MKKRISALLVVFSILFSLCVNALAYDLKAFNDVPKTYWGYSAIMRSVELGLFKGTTAPDAEGIATFDPLSNLSRAQLISVVVRAAAAQELEAAGGEGSSVWYENAVKVALQLGLISDSDFDGLSDLGKGVTREEMAHIIANTLRYRGESPDRRIYASAIKDWNIVSADYRDDVIFAYSEGVLCGYDDGRFDPKDTLNRAQACTVLVRLLDTDARVPVAFSSEVGPENFPVGTIAGPKTVINTKHLSFQIEEGVFCPGNLAELADKLTDTLEAQSGLKFLKNDEDPKIEVSVNHENYYLVYPNVSPESEFGPAYAGRSFAVVSAGDLFLGRSYALAHELSHVLMFCNCKAEYTPDAKVFWEGFAEYNAYRALKYLEENDSLSSFYQDHSFRCISNMAIYDAELNEILAHELSYWLDHDLPTRYNPKYDLGFRLMWYFSEKFGDYGKWIEYLDVCPDGIAAADMAYGEGSTDGFYAWLSKNNHTLFDVNADPEYDLSRVSPVNLYPSYDAAGVGMKLENFRYNGLFISFEDAKTYIQAYKGHFADGLTLTAEGVNVIFFDKNAAIIDEVYSPCAYPLKDVSYIKLDGAGVCGLLSVDGLDTNS